MESTGKWVYGSLITAYKNSEMLFARIHFWHEGFCYVIPESVGQYTGLLDRNGVKIFEGDIVRYKGMELPVRWDTEKAGFFIGNDKYWMMNGIDIEVIGNIHDNPELLEAENGK
jgi:hypothetical protein